MSRESEDAPSLSLLEQQMLLAIIRLHPNGHGLAIRDELKSRAERDVSIGSIYAALERMIDKGFITGRDGEPIAKRGGRRKMFFTATGVGRAALSASLETTRRMLDGLEGAVLA